MTILSQNNNVPAVLCDIDGAISPLGRIDGMFPVARDSVQFSSWYCTEQISQFLKEISQKTYFIFASAWEEDSLFFGREVELRSSGYLDFGREYDGSEWFKETAIKNFVLKNQNRKIIWIEDEAPEYMISWAYENHPEILIVETDPNTAITDNQIKNAMSFIYDTSNF